MTSKQDDERVRHALDALEGASSAQGSWTTHDPLIRRTYRTLVRNFSQRIWKAYKAGRLSAEEASRSALDARNFIMDAARMASTPEGRKAATALKANGRSFDYLTDVYARKLFKRPFAEIDGGERTKVFEAILDAAGRTSKVVDANIRSLGASSRIFWVLTILMAAYDIGSARDKVAATVHLVAVVGVGIVFGEVFGGLIGSFAGPIGTGLGVVAGGVLGGWLVDHFAYGDGDPKLTGH